MGTVELFDHTADVGLRVTAATLDDMFRTSAEALFDYIVVNRSEVREELSETIELRAETALDLLADWLGELIFRCETSHRLYARFEVAIEAESSLKATIYGEPIDRERHVLDHEVKAVTRHGMTLECSEAGWVAEMILDI